MRSKLTLCIVVSLTPFLFAKNPRAYQTGQLVQMDSVYCGIEKDTAAAESERLCQEYVVESERVIYRIRPRDAKRSLLLPIGDRVQFRLQKNKLMLRAEDFDGKEHEYSVISIAPETQSNSADAAPPRINHLQ